MRSCKVCKKPVVREEALCRKHQFYSDLVVTMLFIVILSMIMQIK